MDRRTTEVKLNYVIHFVFEQMWLLYVALQSDTKGNTPTQSYSIGDPHQSW